MTYAAFVAVVLLNGCITQSNQPNLPSAPVTPVEMALSPLPLSPYYLQVGDVLDIKVMLNHELNDQVVVRPDGLVSTPIAYDISAYGHTPTQLQKALEKQYRKKFLHPHVAVIVRSFMPERVYVTGEVNSPGEFATVGPNLTLLQAIARAGGVKDDAGTDNIIILRRGESDKPVAFAANYMAATTGRDPASDVRLAPYDVVFVPRSGVGNIYLYFQEYFQQFVPDSASAGAYYQINPKTIAIP